ncbi:YckD family protein [Bacillus sp. REN16]|uniref:YckD family protein n=1 Tax=Bacillus sp. REN16 TaxID=2887296 RepID=UPI001E4D0098|nr:YckD family protein [Bacillus sp. REN16]MCC3355439.1 YckD family protein [Bacillus sp. REN16]
MKRTTGFILLLSFFLIGGIHASAEMEKDTDQPKVELTDKQKQELDKLYLDLLETKKAIINKYVEYGVLPKEKADKKLNWLDDHYQKIKEHGYIPMHHHKKHKDDEDHKDHD